MNYRKCPECGSIWVCWNWIVGFDGYWYHECWDCGDVCETSEEIADGIPYEKLKQDYIEKYCIDCDIKLVGSETETGKCSVCEGNV